jgi:leucyl aminopeptidase (aminopeptidase T)
MISNELRKAANVVVVDSLRLIPRESFLVVYDSKMENIARAIKEEGEKICDIVFALEVPTMEINGDVPPDQLIDIMKSFDVVAAVTTKAITHTGPRHQATKHGVRVVTISELDEESFIRTVDINMNKLTAMNEEIIKAFGKPVKLRVTTEAGTDLDMTITDREVFGADGRLSKIGAWGNLPSGEVYLAPIEEETNGTLVIDGSVAEVGVVDFPISIEIMDGLIIEIAGKGQSTKAFQELMNEMEIEARTIGEFGIGTNEHAGITGFVAEDEKAMGTCHIAFGNNFSFGGTLSPPAHIDCILKNPNIEVDGRLIMEKGVFIPQVDEED